MMLWVYITFYSSFFHFKTLAFYHYSQIIRLRQLNKYYRSKIQNKPLAKSEQIFLRFMDLTFKDTLFTC